MEWRLLLIKPTCDKATDDDDGEVKWHIGGVATDSISYCNASLWEGSL